MGGAHVFSRAKTDFPPTATSVRLEHVRGKEEEEEDNRTMTTTHHSVYVDIIIK